jgi:serine/threonine protein kinase
MFLTTASPFGVLLRPWMEPGRYVTHNLQLVRVLDTGSMGSVWVAHHLGLGTQVAVKFMSPDVAKNPNLVARFSREAQAAAHIKSRHVVQIYDHGITPDGVPYIAMELLEGESLQKKLKREGRIEVRLTSLIISQTCKALGRAHQLGIVHRDIKPANIFLTDEDGEITVKLLDFGVAKQTFGDLSMTRTNEKVGTPFYMCPEQLISAKHVDFHADIYSIGIVAYHALMGVVPYKANTFGDLCLAVSRGVFALPSESRPDLPLALDAWFLRALAKKPTDRFESSKQAADEFERAIGMPPPAPSHAQG